MLPNSFRGRRFELWMYLVSHRQLLLRSNKSEQHAQRCEILFTNVARVDLPTLVDDLEIHLATDETTPAAVAHLGALERTDRAVYLIRGQNCRGYIVAGSMAFKEDHGEYYSPSGLLQS